MLLLFKKNICTFNTRFILSALFAVWVLTASAKMTKDSFNTKSGTLITFQQFDKEYYETLQYLKFADRLISSYLNSSAIKQNYICRIFVVTDIVKNDIDIVETSGNVNIYLNKNFRTAKNKFHIITKMINAMLLAKTGFKPNEANFSLPQWLLVGIYGKLELRFFSHSILPVTYFPGLKALCQSEKLPDFRIAVSTPLSPERDGTAYLLYQEFCRFIMLEIKRLSSRTDNPIADLIFLTAREKYSSNEIFDYTIVRVIVASYDKRHRRSNRRYNPNSKNNAQKVQEWFKKVAGKRLINPNSPLQTKFFEKRFQRFRKFTCIDLVKGKVSGQMTRDIAKINEIYDKYGMSEGFNEMLSRKNIELDALNSACQPLSIQYIKELRKILSQFDDISSVVIKVRIKKLLVKLNLALEKQQKVEDYLRKVEYTTVAPGKLYRNELIENKRLKKTFFPSINNYLDKVEKSFLKD